MEKFVLLLLFAILATLVQINNAVPIPKNSTKNPTPITSPNAPAMTSAEKNVTPKKDSQLPVLNTPGAPNIVLNTPTIGPNLVLNTPNIVPITTPNTAPMLVHRLYDSQSSQGSNNVAELENEIIDKNGFRGNYGAASRSSLYANRNYGLGGRSSIYSNSYGSGYGYGGSSVYGSSTVYSGPRISRSYGNGYYGNRYGGGPSRYYGDSGYSSYPPGRYSHVIGNGGIRYPYGSSTTIYSDTYGGGYGRGYGRGYGYSGSSYTSYISGSTIYEPSSYDGYYPQ